MLTPDSIVYLACPYSHKDKEVEKDRFVKVTFVAAKLAEKGDITFSPITHNRLINEAHPLPNIWEGFWKIYDGAFLHLSRKLYVLMLEGWEQSTGVQDEIQMAKDWEIPIEYIKYEDYVC